MDREAMLRRAREATDAWNRHDAAAVAAFAAEDATARDVGAPEPIRGRAAIQANVEAYMTAFPDLHIEVLSATCDGERVVQEWVATGTQEGRLMTLEPTHRQARTEAAPSRASARREHGPSRRCTGARWPAHAARRAAGSRGRARLRRTRRHAAPGAAAGSRALSSRVVRVLLTNDDGIEAEGLQALRRALLQVPGHRARRHRAGLQPLRDRPRDHHPAAAVGRGGRLRRRHRRLRDRRDAGGLRALRRARAGRGLRGRADRLGHQPRLQPRRRHHLLRHRGRRARGRRARPAGGRRLPAVHGARDGLPARRASSTSTPRRPSPPGSSRRSRTCRCRAARCSTSTCPRARSPASRSPGSASASTATSSSCRTRSPAGASTASTATRPATATRRGPTSPRSPRAASRSRRCTSTSRTSRGSRRCRPTTSRACCSRPPRRWSE